MSQQAPASAEPTSAVPRNAAANLGAAIQPVLSPAQLESITREARAVATAVREPARSAAAGWYTVKPGDSLSAIAGSLYHNAAAWPVLYWGNHGQIRWADLISVGQVLHVPAEPARIPAAPAQLAPPQPQIRSVARYTPKHANPDPDPDPAPAQAATPPAPPQAPAPAGSASGPWPGGAFGSCVVMRESGGNPNAWNPSGHWGLYQFSASTWAAYGGNPADWGHAGIAEQEQVFMTALSRGGRSNWAPYDGC